ncbi:unnamed protein product, partial [Polarella glacialis]
AIACRCVVRGREQRQALQGFDCEQCRSFYELSTAIGGVALVAGHSGQRALSRHRLEWAPTSTPPGFWDLSFPQNPLEGKALEGKALEALPLGN